MNFTLDTMSEEEIIEKTVSASDKEIAEYEPVRQFYPNLLAHRKSLCRGGPRGRRGGRG